MFFFFSDKLSTRTCLVVRFHGVYYLPPRGQSSFGMMLLAFCLFVIPTSAFHTVFALDAVFAGEEGSGVVSRPSLVWLLQQSTLEVRPGRCCSAPPRIFVFVAPLVLRVSCGLAFSLCALCLGRKSKKRIGFEAPNV